MRLSDIHVVIAGGATAGASTALFFARGGARVTLFERVEHPRAVGAGIALAANGLAVLHALGLGESIERNARTVGAAAVVDGHGRTLFTPPEPRPRIAMTRRSTLQELFMDALEREPGVTVRTGVDVVRASHTGLVTIRENGTIRTLHADLIVGADGVHSSVRENGGFEAEVRPTGISYVRALAPIDAARSEEAWTSAGLFGSFPVDGGTYLYASAGTPDFRRALAARDLSAFRTAWSAAYAPAETLLGAVSRFDDLIVNEVIRVHSPRWVSGKIVLVGDAAHAMAPNLGQGANSALVDAAILYEEVRRAPVLEDGLAAYERRRRPKVERVATMSARLGRLAENTNPIVRFFRDRVLLRVLNRVASPKTNDLVMQESPEVLRNAGGTLS